ncbi:uncharacterized protein LOC128034769 [Gossypium raimondii]|uniref:uncharacterized protein LOC128034769 n=1 Tax=Gossypium raimondii TaxID=29730 RepID=UPI00227B7151|nr:uncharacterized protein LOC128034769 [Gossypium raimondii]
MQGISDVAPIQVTKQVDVPTFGCEICSNNHSYENCPQHAENSFYVSNIRKNSYGTCYNNSARNQQSWGTQNAGQNATTFQYGNISTQEAIVQGNSSSIRALEAQLGQLTSNLNTRPLGTLPSDTKNPIPRWKEHCKAITLRSGKETGEPTTDSTVAPQDTGEVIPSEKVEFEELVDVPNKEVPQIVTHMPNELLFKKKKLSDMETIALTEGCSAVLTNKLPPKMKEAGSFTIPCSIGNHYLGKALCDLGASINLMPLSTFRKLGIGNMKPTAVRLQIAERSLAQPEGKIQDILVRVDKFIFLANFIILDCKVDKKVPIILGRPFLAIGRTLIDVYNGELTILFNDEHITVNVLDDLNQEEFNDQSAILFEEFAVTFNDEFLDNCDSIVEVNNIELKHGWKIESLDLANRTTLIFKPSINEAPTLELKPLPTHLKYVFSW